ncbi:MAG: hemagglutinin repeat-containing protein [Methyloligellaceae bacterium]
MFGNIISRVMPAQNKRQSAIIAGAALALVSVFGTLAWSQSNPAPTPKPEVINIQDPNKPGGISHNKFQNYNVPKEGIILNNSQTDGTSQIGGNVNANPNLQTGTAGIILNEVTGNSRSRLEGTTEVFGSKADVIIANPYGVTCSGCGFINTDRATLSTGRPVFNEETGDFIGLDVHTRDENGKLIKGATVNIEGTGADVKGLEYFDIVSRAIQINADIDGDPSKTRIGLFAGINSYNYKDRTVTVRGTEEEDKPLFGISSSLLGGAYGNKIQMIATEKGVGIKAPKEMKAAYGGIHMSADGKIKFGNAYAKKKIYARSHSSDISVEGFVYSETALELTAGAQVSVLDNMAAGAKGNVTIKSASLDIGTGAKLQADLNENDELVNNGLLTIETAALNNRGAIEAGTDINISGQDFDTDDGITPATGKVENTGQILALGTLNILSGELFNNSGASIRSNSNATLNIADNFRNEGNINSGADINITGTASLQNIGSIDGTTGVEIVGVTLTNSGDVTSGGTIKLALTGNLNNSGQLLAGSNADINAAGSLTNSGAIQGTNGASLTSGNGLNNSGDISSDKTVAINTTGNLTNSGSVNAGGNADIAATGSLTNSGAIQGTNGVSLTSGNGLNNSGDISSDKTVAINTTGNLTNSGSVNAGGNADIAATGSITNSGLLQSGNGTKVTSGGNLNNSGDITSEKSVAINTAGDLTNSGNINAGGGADIDTGGSLINSGEINSAEDLNIAVAGNLLNNGTAVIASASNISLTVVGDLSNSETAKITSGKTLNIEATTLDNFGAMFLGEERGEISGENINLKVVNLNNLGNITATGNIDINADVAVYNTFASIVADGDVDIKAVDLIENLAGTIRGRDVDLSAKTIRNEDLIKRGGNIVLPDFVSLRIQLAVSNMVEEALDEYRLKVKKLDDKAIDALRKQLNEAAQAFVQTSANQLLQNSKSSLAALQRNLINDAVTAADIANTPPKKAKFFNRGRGGRNNFINQSKKTVTRGGRTVNVIQNTRGRSGRGGLFAALIKSQEDASKNNHEEKIAGSSEINATGNLTMTATDDISSVGGNLIARNDINLTAGNDINIDARRMSMRDHRRISGGHDNKSRITNKLNETSAGGNISINAGNDILLKGTRITSGNNTNVNAVGDIKFSSVKDEYHKDYYKKKKSGAFNHKKKKTVHKVDETTTVKSSITSGGEVNMVSEEKGILADAADIYSEGRILLKSNADNVIVKANVDITKTEKYTKKSSGWGLKSSSSKDKGYSKRHEASFVSATGDVILDSGAGDLVINGSVVESDSSIYLRGENISIESVTDVYDESHEKRSKGFFSDSGISTSRIGVSAGYRKERHDSFLGQQVALVSGLFAQGNIVINADNNIVSEAATFQAGGVINVSAGNDIKILSVHDIITQKQLDEVSQVGVTVSITENVSEAVKAIKAAEEALDDGEGNDANRVITAAASAIRAAQAINNLATGQLISLNISIGVSSNKSKFHQMASIAQVGFLQALNDVNLEAGRDFYAEGVQIAAGRDVNISAQRDINIKSAENTSYQKNSTKSRSASVGVSVGIGVTGFSASANASASAQNSNSESTSISHKHANITAGNKVTLKSGKDTNLTGVIVKAPKIAADVGGNLNIASVQDTYTSDSKAVGGSLSYNQDMGGTGSNAKNEGNESLGFSVNYARGKAEMAWTTQQSGLFAEESLVVDVADNTHLKGAVLSADNDNLTINTGTFTYEDLHDKDKRSNVSVSLSGKIGLNNDKMMEQYKKNGQTPPGLLDRMSTSIQTVEGMYATSDKRQITRATVGAGNIEIRNTDAQARLVSTGKTKRLASLNRDLDKAQEITRDDRSYVGVYYDKGTIRDSAAFFKKAKNYIADVFSGDDPATVQKRKNAEELLERAKKGEIQLTSLSDCNSGGGSTQSWLHRVLFTPAYANSGDACVILSKGVDGLYEDKGVRISKEEHDAIRKAMINSAIDGIKDVIPDILKLEDLKQNGKLSGEDAAKLVLLKSNLQSYMGHFELCWDDSYSSDFNTTSLHDYMTKNHFDVGERYFNAAIAMREGGEKFVRNFGAFRHMEAAEIRKIKEGNPGLFSALTQMSDDKQNSRKMLEIYYQVEGLKSTYNMSENDVSHSLQYIAARIISVSTDVRYTPASIFGKRKEGWLKTAEQANALLQSLKGLRPDMQVALWDTVRTKYTYAFKHMMNDFTASHFLAQYVSPVDRFQDFLTGTDREKIVADKLKSAYKTAVALDGLIGGDDFKSMIGIAINNIENNGFLTNKKAMNNYKKILTEINDDTFLPIVKWNDTNEAMDRRSITIAASSAAYKTKYSINSGSRPTADDFKKTAVSVVNNMERQVDRKTYIKELLQVNSYFLEESAYIRNVLALAATNDRTKYQLAGAIEQLYISGKITPDEIAMLVGGAYPYNSEVKLSMSQQQINANILDVLKTTGNPKLMEEVSSKLQEQSNEISSMSKNEINSRFNMDSPLFRKGGPSEAEVARAASAETLRSSEALKQYSNDIYSENPSLRANLESFDNLIAGARNKPVGSFIPGLGIKMSQDSFLRSPTFLAKEPGKIQQHELKDGGSISTYVGTAAGAWERPTDAWISRTSGYSVGPRKFLGRLPGGDWSTVNVTNTIGVRVPISPGKKSPASVFETSPSAIVQGQNYTRDGKKGMRISVQFTPEIEVDLEQFKGDNQVVNALADGVRYYMANFPIGDKAKEALEQGDGKFMNDLRKITSAIPPILNNTGSNLDIGMKTQTRLGITPSLQFDVYIEEVDNKVKVSDISSSNGDLARQTLSALPIGQTDLMQLTELMPLADSGQYRVEIAGSVKFSSYLFFSDTVTKNMNQLSGNYAQLATPTGFNRFSGLSTPPGGKFDPLAPFTNISPNLFNSATGVSGMASMQVIYEPPVIQTAQQIENNLTKDRTIHEADISAVK